MKYFRFIVLLPVWLLFSTAVPHNDDYQSALEVKQLFGKQLSAFCNAVGKLKRVEQKGIPEKMLERYFLETRTAFKRSEFLLNYLENNEVRRINGANLVVNEYDIQAPEEIQPHGLQVIEALIYHPDGESREVLRKEIELLEALVATFKERNSHLSIPDPKEFNIVVWDALRYEVYRIESLGITGFDVPDSEHSLPESVAALESMMQVTAAYKSLFIHKQLRKTYLEGRSTLQNAIRYLEKHDDFDAFDRLAFMKDHLHPISVWLTKSVSLLGLNYPSDVRPLQADAQHLFSRNIFNDAYFSPNSSESKIALGKMLFEDPVLSENGTRSCTSCHNPQMAFADGIVKSKTMDGQDFLLRNTPSLWNVGWQTKQFYDSRVRKLEKQSLDVIHNQQEMGGNLIHSVEKLKGNGKYQQLFNVAYEGTINEYTVVNAISAYIRSLTSFNARFDRYLRGENVALTAEEKQGFNLFTGKAKCATCHFMPLFNGLVPPRFTETESEILGVPANKLLPSIIDSDEGKYRFTKLELHRYAFKTPGLRNVELTAPYMHNGVFSTLEEVVEFYNNGGGAGQGMNLQSQTLPADSLHLNAREKASIVSFLKSLTDESGH